MSDTKNEDRARAKACDEAAARLGSYPKEIQEIVDFETSEYQKTLGPLFNDIMSMVGEAGALYDYTKRVELIAEIIVGNERIRYTDRIVTISSEARDED